MSNKKLGDEQLKMGLAICRGISGGLSVKKAAENNGSKEATFFDWLIKSDKLSEEYVKARVYRADARYESIDGVIDDMRNKDIDSSMARVQIDTIKWQCGREKGGVYGDSTQIKHADANGDKLDFSSILEVIDGKTAGLPKDN